MVDTLRAVVDTLKAVVDTQRPVERTVARRGALLLQNGWIWGLIWYSWNFVTSPLKTLCSKVFRTEYFGNVLKRIYPVLHPCFAQM